MERSNVEGRRQMKSFVSALKLMAAVIVLFVVVTGCESTDGGGSVQVGAYYGVGVYDPWYYGGAYYPPDVIVTPPPPGGSVEPPRPEHPIVKPSPAPSPSPRPMPSIPRTPRPAPRGGGRR